MQNIGKTLKGVVWPDKQTPAELEDALEKEAGDYEAKATHVETVAEYRVRIEKAKARIKATGSGYDWHSKKLLIVVGIIIIIVVVIASSC